MESRFRTNLGFFPQLLEERDGAMSHNLIFESVLILLFGASILCEFNENAPDLVKTRKKMLDILAADQCENLNKLRPFRVHLNRLQYTSNMLPEDRDCEEVLGLMKSLPPNEVSKCTNAVKPRCRQMMNTMGEYQWMCTVEVHTADDIEPPVTLTMDFCTMKSQSVYFNYLATLDPEVAKRMEEEKEDRTTIHRSPSQLEKRSRLKNMQKAVTDKISQKRKLERVGSDMHRVETVKPPKFERVGSDLHYVGGKPGLVSGLRSRFGSLNKPDVKGMLSKARRKVETLRTPKSGQVKKRDT